MGLRRGPALDVEEDAMARSLRPAQAVAVVEARFAALMARRTAGRARPAPFDVVAVEQRFAAFMEGRAAVAAALA